MLSQEQLNSEIDLAKRIYIYYCDKMADYITVGSDSYLQWYKDLCVIYFLTKTMMAIRLDTGELYIGDTKVTMDYFQMTTSGIREFLTYDIRTIVYAELDEQGDVKDFVIPAVPPTLVTYQGFTQDWRSSIVIVTEDDITEVTLPFNASEVDLNSVIVTVNDNNPIPNTDSQSEGCTIANSTLYWHNYYNLKAGDIIYIQYLANNNSPGLPSAGQCIQAAVAVTSNYTLVNTWVDTSISGDGDYSIHTPVYPGYAYAYITVPSLKSSTIYDALGINIQNTFTLVGNVTLNSGEINKVYRKTNQFDATLGLNLIVKIY